MNLNIICEYYYLDENNKECHYKGKQDSNLWGKLNNSYWNRKDQIYKFHRLNGPAFLHYVNDKLIIYGWFLNGFSHREDGRYNNHSYDFKLKGKSISSYNFAQQTNHLVCKNCKTFCKQFCF